MNEVTRKSLGQISFDAYRLHRRNIAYDQSPIPTWETLNPDIQEAWEEAAQAVSSHLITLSTTIL